MIICLADETQHPDREAMHKHLRRLRLTQEKYYTEYHPRFDLFTGEPIPFSSTEQYLKTDFVSKHNIKKFIKQKPDEARAWAIKWLKDRKEERNLIFPPTHVELRSLMCPTVRYYNSIGGYNNICSELGYELLLNGEPKYESLPADTVILQDSREQKPLKFAYKTEITALNVGDYGLAGRNVVVERKSLADFVGTLTSKPRRGNNTKQGIERFRGEMDRAKESGTYVVMVVESNIGDALGFNFLPQMRFTKSRPEHVFKNLRDIFVDYPHNFQALFVSGRFEAAQAIVKIFEAGESIKKFDVQFLYEEGLIKFE